ncbi:hypothetical protein CN926_26615 [Bacillus thuringiensis]|uniref:NUMOD3 domain-containing DNA-binding protein n=1 Tax=Bacillus TaxID=1386 RepID=UPI000BED4B33|nr:NUMOD3 domain-containing DNA-binding protein [Bacillus thuringiensis]PEF25695.1 hypothetical protein CON39_30830 [Bacillus thuringiensis]PET90379.1 hypothetical protein CN529_13655 [Bacillus thuringiensis]PEY54710.1 hypothetical protein CN359_14905 [Bacillus thuringiensis]PFA32231.1 hypothetical protein CN416_29115 [Bacillus thuringiensis]PFE68780.1 hypothetical protein CN333_29510 [Bacillus thuringiensis]
MDRRFYIYEWIRLDTNEPFYVGKGSGNRAYQIDKSRNRYFKNILTKTEVAVAIISNNLTEKEAYDAEVWFIYEYKHILNYKLVNLDDGGLGAVEGKFNHMYGRKGSLHPNYGVVVSEETRRKQSLARSGKRNGMYGKRGDLSPIYGRKRNEQERVNISQALKGKKKSEEHKRNLKIAREKMEISGSNNPNYGNGQAIAGGKNPAAVKVKVTDNLGNVTIYETKEITSKQFKISLYLLTKLLGKKISVEDDFNRQKSKYRHLEGYKFDLLDEGVTTSRKTYTISE